MTAPFAGTAHDQAALLGVVGGLALGFVFGVLTGFGFGIAATADPPPSTAPDPAIVDDATHDGSFRRRTLRVTRDAAVRLAPAASRSALPFPPRLSVTGRPR